MAMHRSTPVHLNLLIFSSCCIVIWKLESHLQVHSRLHFELQCGAKQGSVLASTVFGIFICAILHYAFHDEDKKGIIDGVLLRT